MSLKAGVVQFSPLYGRSEENLDRLERLVAVGVAQGAKLLVLPEMAWTGYLWPNRRTVGPYAERVGDGAGQRVLQEWARRWSVNLACGFPEVDGPTLYNSQVLVSPEGIHPVYRKTHLFEADTWWAEPGDSGYRQWSVEGALVGSGICMDLNYPDLVEWHADRRTDILAFSTNWLDQDFDVIPYWEEKLGGEAGRGFKGLGLFANRGGEEFGVPFRGQSAVFWEGRCVAQLPGKEDGVLVLDVPTA